MKSYGLEGMLEAGLVEAGGEEHTAVIRDEDIRDCVDEPFVHEGDLTLDGELHVEGGTLIVKGNLTVAESVGTDETGTIIVTGDLTCRHIYLEGNFEVHGNVNVRGVVYGFYEAGISRAYGSTKARIGLFGNHDWECADERYEVKASFSNYRELAEGDPVALKKALGDKAFAGLSRLMGISDVEAPEAANNAAWGLSLLKDL